MIASTIWRAARIVTSKPDLPPRVISYNDMLAKGGDGEARWNVWLSKKREARSEWLRRSIATGNSVLPMCCSRRLPNAGRP